MITSRIDVLSIIPIRVVSNGCLPGSLLSRDPLSILPRPGSSIHFDINYYFWPTNIIIIEDTIICRIDCRMYREKGSLTRSRSPSFGWFHPQRVCHCKHGRIVYSCSVCLDRQCAVAHTAIELQRLPSISSGSNPVCPPSILTTNRSIPTSERPR